MSKDLKNEVLNLFKQVRTANFGNAEWFFLSSLAQQVGLVRGFQYLLSLEDLNITLYPHQEEAVLRVLQSMQGSALLADEVGLGKTIIALTVLSELKIRDLVKSILIIVPSSLVDQWYDELHEKFNIDIPIAATGKDKFDRDQILTTTPLFTRYAEKITNRQWDMVIVDEAHRIKNRDSIAWTNLNMLKKKYMLLLTATPMENYLEDIYSLTTLLKPIFGSYKQFRKEFAIPKDPRGCNNPIELRRRLNDIMIRRKRDEIKGIFFPERVAKTLQFEMTQDEATFYKAVTDYVRTTYTELENVESASQEELAQITKKFNITMDRFFTRKVWLHKFTLMLLQRRICSSPLAVKLSVEKMLESRKAESFSEDAIPVFKTFQHLGEYLSKQQSTKMGVARQLLEQLSGKCVVFTEFADTLNYIETWLSHYGFNYIKFSGELSSSQRADVIRKFREEKDILVSTDAGSEGLNLQVANTLINYDLPWNPMRVEQRIGRVYRLTQKADKVNIFNLVSKNTVEAYVLDILYKKIGVFKTILGDLSSILGSLVQTTADGKGTQLEAEIMKFFVKHGHSEKLRKELEDMIAPVVDKITVQDDVSKNVLDVDTLVEKY
nr:SNF2-related protein [Candidatus Sigynarchaeota archaeon]